jgi:hypothetical protein
MTVRAETVLAGLRATYGAVQLTAPSWSAEQQLGGPLDATGQQVVRVLGARQVLQAGLALAFPDEPLLGLGIGVDALHALSMLPVAVTVPRWRRAALVSALMGTAFATAGVLASGQLPATNPFVE